MIDDRDDVRETSRRRGRAIVAALLGDASMQEKQGDRVDRARQLARGVLWLRRRVDEARLR